MQGFVAAFLAIVGGFFVRLSLCQSYYYFNGHYYMPWASAVYGYSTYEEVDMIAYQMGGYLLQIDSNEENAFVTNKLSAPRSFIGIKRCEHDINAFCQFGTNTVIAYSNWATSEPNNANSKESCVAIVAAAYIGQGTWSDVDCSLSLGWVMEFDQEPFAAMLTPKPTIAPTVQPALPYRRFNGHYYAFQRYSTADFLTASSQAASQGGYLVRINDLGENNFIQYLFQVSGCNPWIGLKRCDTDPALFCYFDTDTAQTFSNFESGESGNLLDQCVRMMSSESGTWEDVYCMSSNCYVIEFDSQPADATGQEVDETNSVFTMFPSLVPSVFPSRQPVTTNSPSIRPSQAPSYVPSTLLPSMLPTRSPTQIPSLAPTRSPTYTPGTYRKYKGQYYSLSPANLYYTWGDAKAAAEARGGYLVQIGSQAENDFVRSLVQATGSSAWIGVRRCLLDNNQFCYSDGSSALVYSNWYASRANDPNQQCVSMYGWFNAGEWTDAHCTNTMGRFVAEYDSVPIGASGLEVDEFTQSPSAAPSTMPTRRPSVSPSLVQTRSPTYTPGTYRKYKGQYYSLSPESFSYFWADAKAAAEARGGYLVQIGSQAENDFVTSLVEVTGSPSFWIGVRRCLLDNNQFCYSDGSSALVYSNWYASRANDPNQQCARMYGWFSAGEWTDAHCTNTMGRFVAEYDSVPIGASGLEVDEFTQSPSAAPTSIAPSVRPSIASSSLPTVSPGTYRQYNGHYYRLVMDLVSWETARSRALAMGGYLVNINDVEENIFIRKVFNVKSWQINDGYRGSWLGMRRCENSPNLFCLFDTSNDVPLTFSDWQISYDPKSVKEDCAMFSYRELNNWITEDCSQSYYYLVEFDSRPIDAAGSEIDEKIPSVTQGSEVYYIYNNHYYYHSTEDLTWQQAQAKAAKRGGYLVNIDSSDESTFVKSLPLIFTTFIGVRRCSTDSSSYCPAGQQGGTPISYSDWAPGQPPSDFGGETDLCAGIFLNNFNWYSYPCNYAMNHVMEFDSFPDSDGTSAGGSSSSSSSSDPTIIIVIVVVVIAAVVLGGLITYCYIRKSAASTDPFASPPPATHHYPSAMATATVASHDLPVLVNVEAVASLEYGDLGGGKGGMQIPSAPPQPQYLFVSSSNGAGVVNSNQAYQGSHPNFTPAPLPAAHIPPTSMPSNFANREPIVSNWSPNAAGNVAVVLPVANSVEASRVGSSVTIIQPNQNVHTL